MTLATDATTIRAAILADRWETLTEDSQRFDGEGVSLGNSKRIDRLYAVLTEFAVLMTRHDEAGWVGLETFREDLLAIIRERMIDMALEMDPERVHEAA